MPQKKKRKPKAAVIIPTFNEKENIGELVEQLVNVSKSLSKRIVLDIVVVDDNSPDGTAFVVKEKCRKYSIAHLIENSPKAGLGNAYLTGMGFSTESLNADILMEMDADFSHDPKKVPELLDKIAEGYDLVLGSRYIKGGSIPEK